MRILINGKYKNNMKIIGTWVYHKDSSQKERLYQGLIYQDSRTELCYLKHTDEDKILFELKNIESIYTKLSEDKRLKVLL